MADLVIKSAKIKKGTRPHDRAPKVGKSLNGLQAEYRRLQQRFDHFNIHRQALRREEGQHVLALFLASAGALIYLLGGFYGGFYPALQRIEEYLTKILNRIVLPGSIYLALIAVIPTIVIAVIPAFPTSVAYLMGGTSLLILVGVDLDTMSQIEGLLKMHHHDGLVKRGRLRGRNL